MSTTPAARSASCRALLSPRREPSYVAEVRGEYAKIAAAHARAQDEQGAAAARRRRAPTRSSSTGRATCRRSRRFLGTQRASTTIRLAELVALHRLDAVLPDLGADRHVSRHPRRRQSTARRRAPLYDDAQAMLEQDRRRAAGSSANAVVGFWPANAHGDDIVLYTDETRGEPVATLHTLRQQLSQARGPRQYRAGRFRRAARQRACRLHRRLRRHRRHRRGRRSPSASSAPTTTIPRSW